LSDVVYDVLAPANAMFRRKSEVAGSAAAELDWLTRFHSGERPTIEGLYRAHFERIAVTLTPLLGKADAETVIHEIFFRLLTQPTLRGGFRGGDVAAWLSTVARNHAIDYLRRSKREVPAGGALAALDNRVARSWEANAEARLLVERFRRDVLPAKWAPVFEARFMQQLSQQEAAASLGMGRTTLAYREARVRRLLRKSLLKGRR
jgi:RNA polymerase sigma-70 factor (ECF subfamily)